MGYLYCNFSFSHSVFKRLKLQTRKNQILFGKGLIHAQMVKPVFYRTENIMGKITKNPFPTMFSKGFFLRIFNPFPNKAWFLRVCSTSLLKTLREKEKLLVTSNFSFSPSVFYPFGELSAIFNKLEIVVCKLSQFG